ncbi:MAM and LDL-receptor class A domain-containing protein 1-like [Ptychodera flava]|uniref:MAM and LDL-receptor class A domain-containing protein 1-like n=1 Tax=Ptychodera flava TaxID=63121 RepID=UPI003969FBE1
MARSKKVAQKKAASSSASSKRAVTGMVPANGSCLQQQTVNSIIVISFYNSAYTGCDFESETMCNGTNDGTDDFDWSISTGDDGIGPSLDHTYESGTGHYLLVEGTSTNESQTARFLTDTLTLDSNKCLQFFFAWQGLDVGMLSVRIKIDNNLRQPILERKLQIGDGWNIGRVSLAQQANFQVVFEFVRGAGETGYVVIDDIQVMDIDCPNPSHCDFEDGKCSWSNIVSGDDLDWMLQSGSTSTPSTGPTADHTTGNIDDASNAYAGFTAKLYSQTLSAKSTIGCLEFWYNMYGETMGTLRVDIVTSDDPETPDTIWTLSGNQGIAWKCGRVSFSQTTEYQECQRPPHCDVDYANDDTNSISATANTQPSCSPNEFYCNADSRCISADRVCDFRRDCTDGDDEVRCGVYLYFVASNAYAGVTAKLYSQTFPAMPTAGCLEFWYKMNGGGMGTLRVDIVTSDDPDTPYTIWTLSGNQGSAWKCSRVSFSQTTEYQLVFVAIRGSFATSDIAIDDVVIMDGYCTGVPETTTVDPQTNAMMSTTQITTPTPFPPSPTPQPSCSPNEFYCNADSRCISADRVCDFRRDCTDGDDEVRCVFQDCDFEGNTWCNWINDQNDTFDWILTQGSTSSPHTGPSVDHTYGTYTGCNFESETMCNGTNDGTDDFDWSISTGNDGIGPSLDHTYESGTGHYLLAEGTSTNEFQTARFLTDILTLDSNKCLQFFFAWQGLDVGMLKVRIKIDNSFGQPIWERKLQIGDGWNIGRVSLAQQANFQVVFEFVRGAGETGYVVIDDIQVMDIDCPNPSHCDFEDGKCSWSNIVNGDDLDWILRSGSTSTGGTGPTADHTTGNIDGFYLYLEASNAYAGVTAKLYSQTFPAKSTTGCLEFWYNMNGGGMGTLRVDIVISDGPKTPDTIWTLSGNQGSTWKCGRVSFSQTTEYQLVFVAVRGNGPTSDIAIDDVVIMDGYCTGLPETTTLDPQTNALLSTTPMATPTQFPSPPTPQPSCSPKEFYCNADSRCISADMVCDFRRDCTDGDDEVRCVFQDCDFEGNTWCNWTNDQNDIFDWTLTQGSTSSPHTGPSVDHTYGTYTGCDFESETMCNGTNDGTDDFDWSISTGDDGIGPSLDHTYESGTGFYLYLEASSAYAGVTAKLYSQTFPAKSTTGCLEFWYNMNGGGMGTLRVDIVISDGPKTPDTIWTLSGNQGSTWKCGRVSFSQTTEYQLVFVAIRGNWPNSDIAIDDVVISDGYCTGMLETTTVDPQTNENLYQ